MNIDKTNNITFGYSTLLSQLYKKGKLPSVQYGLYGQKLTSKTVSNEHLVPHSQGGKTTLNNIALADRFINSRRGSQDIRLFLTKEMILNYLKQFINVKIKEGKKLIFSGNQYIKSVLPTFKKLGFDFNI